MVSTPVRIYDGAGIPITSTDGKLDVNAAGITIESAEITIADNATATKQDAQTALLTSVDADTSNISTKTDSILAKITASAATAANQGTEITALGTIDTSVGTVKTAVDAVTSKLSADPATETTLAALNTKVTACNTGAVVGTVAVTGLNSGTGAAKALYIDSLGYGLVTETTDDNRIHLGQMFRCGGITPEISNNNTYTIHIKTPVSNSIHFRMDFSGTEAYSYAFYEAPTVTVNGSAALVYNRNRQSANTTSVAVYTVPTITSAGTLLATKRIGSSGGSIGALSEFVLKQNTSYSIVITAHNNTMYVTWWCRFVEM